MLKAPVPWADVLRAVSPFPRQRAGGAAEDAGLYPGEEA